MHRLTIVVAMLVLFAAAPVRAAAPSWRTLGFVLLQPEAALRERVPGGAQAMSDYIASIDAAATKALAGVDPPRPTSGFLVLAVRQGGRSKAWLDLWPNLPRASEPALVDAVQAVKPFAVSKGTVVFALRVSAWGGADEPAAETRRVDALHARRRHRRGGDRRATVARRHARRRSARALTWPEGERVARVERASIPPAMRRYVVSGRRADASAGCLPGRCRTPP